ncbi:MAG TPA: chromate resistance protein ChrB domain-containing protein [Gemmatimonadales bacterium]|nr:chromate resistance protein ChrB domain-containing protein [Gemmatimonadales bacterium]
MVDPTVITAQEAGSDPPWLLLIHRLPPKPDYLRVKVRRRLQRLGALPLKNSVYVLPRTEEALEDLLWLQREIAAEGAEATVCEASFVAGMTNAEIAGMFSSSSAPLAGADDTDRMTPGRTWVTRQNVHVDRIASAWLIRRFIDGEARFKFVPARGYQPQPGELRFDMFEAEYTHEGDRCTFETLVKRFRLKDRALRAIGEIVHDVDCKDEKFGRPEAAGVASLIQGIARAHPADADRIERGSQLFDDLYARFRTERD